LQQEGLVLQALAGDESYRCTGLGLWVRDEKETMCSILSQSELREVSRHESAAPHEFA
jgi:hypothetical protein